MLRLPKQLVDYFRSFLKTSEIYQSALVCKAWCDVSDVSKELWINNSNLPPLHANLGKVNSACLMLIPVSNALDIINGCRCHLKKLLISKVAFVYPLHFPQLDSLTELELRGCHSDVIHEIMRHTPNLNRLELSQKENIDSLDFSLVPKLKLLFLRCHVASFENAAIPQLEKIHCSWNLMDTITPLTTLQPTACVFTQVPCNEQTSHIALSMIEEHKKAHWTLYFLCSNPSFHVTIDINPKESHFHSLVYSGNPICLHKASSKIKALMQKLKSFGRPIRIAKDRPTSHELLATIALTKEFSVQEIGQMCF